jgi:ketosteroid isomerase-like protein
MSDELNERVARLERAEWARNALARYVRFMDGGDIGGLAAHFDADVTFVGADGVERKGRDAVVEFFTGLFAAGGTGGAHHLVTNIDVESAEADRTVLRSAFALVYAAGEASFIGAGSYYDVFVIRDGAALCVEKRITLDHMLPVPAPATADPS